MPSTRTRTKRGAKLSLMPDVWAYLTDEIGEYDSLLIITLSDDERLKIWSEYRDDILDKWIEQRPGTRPRLWWRFDAPKDLELMQGTAWQGVFPIARRQLGGAGCAVWQRLDYVPVFDKGIPAIWLDYNADDPPVYESEYVYLSRYGLLVNNEKTKHSGPEVCSYLIDNNFKEVYRLDITKGQTET